MGSKIPVITKAIRENNIKLENDKYIVGGEETIILNKEDLLISYVAKSNIPVLNDESVVVALDLNVSEELRKEGIARELVRNIQEARKQMDLAITDRIEIEFNGDYPVEYSEYICKETLGSIKELETNSNALMIEVEGISISVVKAN